MTSTKAKNSNKNIEYKIPNKLANTSREPNSQCENSIPAKPKNADVQQPDIKTNHTNSKQLTLQGLSSWQPRVVFDCHSRSLLPSGD